MIAGKDSKKPVECSGNKRACSEACGDVPFCDYVDVQVTCASPGEERVQTDPGETPGAAAVYLALRDMPIFKTNPACNAIRFKNALKKRVKSGKVKTITEQYGEGAFYEMATALHAQHVFWDIEAAKAQFPELFEGDRSGEEGQEDVSDPVLVDAFTQRKLIAALVDVLEQACFRFLQREAPDITGSRGWDSGAAAGLKALVDVIRAPPPDSGLGLLADAQGICGRMERIFGLYGQVSDVRSILEAIRDVSFVASELTDEAGVETIKKFESEVGTKLRNYVTDRKSIEDKAREREAAISDARMALVQAEEDYAKTKKETIEMERSTASEIMCSVRGLEDCLLELSFKRKLE